MFKNKNFLLMLFIIINIAFSLSEVNAQTPPERPGNFTASYPVYTKAANENTVNLSWNASVGADFYIINITSETNWAGQSINQQVIVNGLNYSDIRENSTSNPSSGTAFTYKLYAATYLLDEFGNLTTDYVASSSFSSMTVLTDPIITATSLSTTETKLKWDNIQYNGENIDYQLYIYRDNIRIGQEQIKATDIGDTVITSNGKIEYIVSGLDKSTEYTFRLLTSLDNALVKFNPYVEFSGATKISAYLQKYNESIMKLVWDEYQGSVPSSDLYYKVIEVSMQNGTKTYKVIATPEVPYYFIQIKANNEYYYLVQVLQKDDDKKIAESSEVSLNEIIIPSTPPIPNIEPVVQNDKIILEWVTPKNIDGSTDVDIKYDVWMSTNPDKIDNVRKFYLPDYSGITDERLGINLQVVDGISTDSNFYLIENDGEDDKYSFSIMNLDMNTNYYIGVVAKKTFLMQDLEEQDEIISSIYVSEPCVLNIKTTSGNIEQPIALVKPSGAEIKTDGTGKAMVTSDSITLKWPLGEMINGTFVKYYQDDVYFRVGYEVYSPSFDKSKINDQNNPNYNINTTDVIIDLEDEEAHAHITDLTTNTLYVFWVKAYRDIPVSPVIVKVSEASDPIVVATLPNYTIPDMKPPVPALSIIENTYYDKVKLQFNSVAGVKYTIIWGTTDKYASMTYSKTYTASSDAILDTVTIEELDSETTYYFRIKATYNDNNSDWSDSVMGRTIAIPPPDAPKGFGVKHILKDEQLVSDIGEHYVTLQWALVDGLTYYIQVSRSDDFDIMEEISASSISEYKVEKYKGKELSANTRYWFRIYAKDASTDKISEFSPSLTVKTKSNYDEYDSSADIDAVIDNVQEKVTIDGTTGVWSFDVTGSTADVLIEQKIKDDVLDYEIDMSQTSVSGINNREILIPYKVLKALSDAQQNMLIKADKATLTLLPGWISAETVNRVKPSNGDDIVVKIYINSQNSISSMLERDKNISNTIELSTYISGSEESEIKQFDNSIGLDLVYTKDTNKGVVVPYYMEDGLTDWSKISDSKNNENESTISFYYDKSGKFVVKKQKTIFNSTYDNEISNIIFEHDFKSVDDQNVRLYDSMKMSEMIMILLDASSVDYMDNYMEIASKAGLLSEINDIGMNRNLSRQESVWMIMKLYEIKSGNQLSNSSISTYFTDAQTVNSNYVTAIGNAIKMNVLVPASTQIKPDEIVTRGEVFAMLHRLLNILETL